MIDSEGPRLGLPSGSARGSVGREQRVFRTLMK
jgi:hypothetical protein